MRDRGGGGGGGGEFIQGLTPRRRRRRKGGGGLSLSISAQHAWTTVVFKHGLVPRLGDVAFEGVIQGRCFASKVTPSVAVSFHPFAVRLFNESCDHGICRSQVPAEGARVSCSMARKVEPEETAAYFDHTVVGG